MYIPMYIPICLSISIYIPIYIYLHTSIRTWFGSFPTLSKGLYGRRVKLLTSCRVPMRIFASANVAPAKRRFSPATQVLSDAEFTASINSSVVKFWIWNNVGIETWLYLYKSIYLSIYLSTYLPTYLPSHPCIQPAVHPWIIDYHCCFVIINAYTTIILMYTVSKPQNIEDRTVVQIANLENMK